MEVVNGKYMVECTPSGDYYGYLMGYDQCCAYGETVEDVICLLYTSDAADE